jgi:hypothetical protein
VAVTSRPPDLAHRRWALYNWEKRSDADGRASENRTAWRFARLVGQLAEVVEAVKKGRGMAEEKDALLQLYRQTREGLLAAIDGLDDEQMSDPSLDGWSVKDHLAHIALWDDVRAAEVERISSGNDSAWRMTDEQDEAYNVLGYELRIPLSVPQVRWELDRSRQRLLAAIAASTPRGLDGSLYGEAGLRSEHEVAHAGWIRRWRGERGI